MKRDKKFILTVLFYLGVVCMLLLAGLWLWLRTRYWTPIETHTGLSESFQERSNLMKLDQDTITQADEIATLRPPHDANGVVEMIQGDLDGNLLVVYKSGAFRRWDLSTRELLAEYDFLVAEPRGVSISASGLLVVTPGQVNANGIMIGYTLWDTRTGGIVECHGSHRPEEWSGAESKYRGIGLTPDSRWIIDYYASMIGASGVDLKISNMWDVDPNPNDFSYHIISSMAFDSTGTYMTCATEEGRLLVYDVEKLFNPAGYTNQDIELGKVEGDYSAMFHALVRSYGHYQKKRQEITIDLAMDDSLNWLAQLTEQDLIVQDLGKNFFPRWMKVPVEGGKALAFNHNGTLLAIGTEIGIHIIDIKKRRQIAMFDVGEVTALTFSLDDRLLIWGDQDGAIHLWGVEE